LPRFVFALVASHSNSIVITVGYSPGAEIQLRLPAFARSPIMATRKRFDPRSALPGSPFLTHVALREDRVQPGVHPFTVPWLLPRLDLQLSAPDGGYLVRPSFKLYLTLGTPGVRFLPPFFSFAPSIKELIKPIFFPLLSLELWE
jgi:hypothetical protein